MERLGRAFALAFGGINTRLLTQTCAGLEVNFLVHLLSFASKIFSTNKLVETTSNFFPKVWETWIILPGKRLLVDIFLTRRLSKSLEFCELASVNLSPGL